MRRLAVLNVVGLSESLLGTATPRIQRLIEAGSSRRIQPAVPAVTCTAQSNYLTGKLPREHGIVANGWYHRELAEVQFWKQSNRLVTCPKIWDHLRESNPGFTCANLFWWYNMYSTVDYAVTPRPAYPADGRKVFDIYSWPYEVRTHIKRDLGEFPFFGFWGPAAGRDTPQGSRDVTTRWIANAAKWMEEHHSPTLNLVYLPHLDYNLQRLGPKDPEILEDLRLIDDIVGDLADFFARRSVEVILLSEYGISGVTHPIHLNRLFRDKGWLTVKEELGRELLDAGASRAFAVADHQVAHVYVQDPTVLSEVRTLLEATEGIRFVWDEIAKPTHGLDHPRSGDLVAMAEDDAWFTYYYWTNDQRAPDFARTVDIHRKPGFDPVELFIDPQLRSPKLHIARRLLQKKLGFRMLMDVIPLDATLVKGSHGGLPEDQSEWPILITPSPDIGTTDPINSSEVFGVIAQHLSE
jgi:predicted AlkP superfamily pyrophosphatase or phosphodiesterase